MITRLMVSLILKVSSRERIKMSICNSSLTFFAFISLLQKTTLKILRPEPLLIY
jgi:hypothetical protein